MAIKITPLEGEEILYISRKLPLKFLKQIIISFGLMVISIICLILGSNQYLFLIGISLLIVVFVLSFIIFIAWYNDINIITNKRVVMIEKSGFFSHKVSEISFSDIAATSYTKKGFGGFLLNIGEIEILDRFGNKTILKNLISPNEFHEISQTIINRMRASS